MRSSSVSINREEKSHGQSPGHFKFRLGRQGQTGNTHRVGAASEVGGKGELCPGIK